MFPRISTVREERSGTRSGAAMMGRKKSRKTFRFAPRGERLERGSRELISGRRPLCHRIREINGRIGLEELKKTASRTERWKRGPGEKKESLSSYRFEWKYGRIGTNSIYDLRVESARVARAAPPRKMHSLAVSKKWRSPFPLTFSLFPSFDFLSTLILLFLFSIPRSFNTLHSHFYFTPFFSLPLSLNYYFFFSFFFLTFVLTDTSENLLLLQKSVTEKARNVGPASRLFAERWQSVS